MLTAAVPWSCERVASDAPSLRVHALRPATDRFSRHINSLLASTSQGIYGLGLDGRCKFINSAGAALLGYAPDELVGRPMHPLVHYQHADGTPFRIETCPLLQTMRTVTHVTDRCPCRLVDWWKH